MSRFVNLELGGESQDPLHQQAVVKDEAYYLRAAQAAFESANFEQALRMFGRVLEFNAHNTIAWSGQVRMLIELGQLQEAKLWADKALERFPRDPELLAAKAVALARGGDLEGAMLFSNASLEEKGDLPYPWLARADVLLARKEARADYCFEKALMLAPRDWFVAWLAARIRYFYDQFAHALKLLQEAVQLNPGHFLVWLELGIVQEALGLFGPAQVSLAQAQQLNPGCQSTRQALSRIAHHGLGGRLRGWCRRLFSR